MKTIIKIFCTIIVLNSSAQNLTNRKVYNFEPGDIFQTEGRSGCSYPFFYSYSKDSVISKVSSVNNDTIFYNLFTELYYPYRGPILPPLDTIYFRTLFYTNLDSIAKHYIYNSCLPPTDTIYQSSFYCNRNVWQLHSNGGVEDSCFEPPSFTSKIIEGCGGPYYFYEDGGSPCRYSFDLIYYKKANVICGSLITSLSNIVLSNTSNIFPNPSQGLIYLMDYLPEIPFEISDLMGRKMRVGKFESDHINISELKNGLYIVKIFRNNNTTFHKIQKIH